MLVKWAIIGLVIGTIAWPLTGDPLMPLIGAALGVAFRKLIVKTFWK